jgi:hypothetical protein
MSTELATQDAVKDDYPALVPNSRAARIIQKNTEGEPIRETDLTRVKTPTQGGTKWTIEHQGNTEQADEIVGLLVAVCRRGELWPSEDPGKNRPLIVTNDFVTGYRVGEDFGTIDPKVLEEYRTGDRTYDWAAMTALGAPFGWDSGKGGVGKRVKESRLLAVLRPGTMWPLIIKAGPGSVQNIVSFLKTLECFSYEAVVGLRLQKAESTTGVVYSQIVPRLVKMISEEEGEAVLKLYHEPLMAMLAGNPLVD